jgi:hypothetical protein
MQAMIGDRCCMQAMIGVACYSYDRCCMQDCPSLHSGQFRDQKSLDLHEKSLDLSNYEIFPQKILKYRTFKKSSILKFKIISELFCFDLPYVICTIYQEVCVRTFINMHILCRKLEPWEKFCVHMDRALETMARLVRENRGGLVGDLLR